MSESERWWKGPSFLRVESPSAPPEQPAGLSSEAKHDEAETSSRMVMPVKVNLRAQQEDTLLFDIAECSSLKTLVNRTKWIAHFAHPSSLLTLPRSSSSRGTPVTLSSGRSCHVGNSVCRVSDTKTQRTSGCEHLQKIRKAPWAELSLRRRDGGLPSFRVEPSRASAKVGLDYFGPMQW